MLAHKKLAILVFLFSLFFVSCLKPAKKIFETLPSSTTNIHFANTLDMDKSFRILYFFYYYNGGGVATGDINNDGLADIFFTANNRASNKLYLNKGNFKFEDITERAGVAGISDWCTGVTMADVNGDGFLDIYVSSVNNVYNFKGHNELFINNQGNGSFTESSQKYGLDISSYSNQASFFDYDHDGDLDCYILNQSFKPAENVVDTVNRRKYDANSGDRLLRNEVNITGKFTDVSAKAGIYQSSLGYGLGIAVADFNNDGWEDIYIGNDFHENDYYYLNNANGTFTESGNKHFKHYSRFSMGNDAADYNNDGQLDIFTADMLPPDEKTLKTYGSGESADIYNFLITKNGFQPQFSKNSLHKNNGNGISFSDVSLINGVAATDWSWCPLFADFDNDGYKDLFVSTGIVKRTVDMDYIRFISDLYIPPGTDPKEKYNEALTKIPDGASHNFVFKGKGNQPFIDKSQEWGLSKDTGYFTGAAYADFDNDGDLDMTVNNVNKSASIYRNNVSKKSYLQISFEGNNLNTKGIGTKVYLFSKGSIQYQQLMATRGFQSSSETKLHFGLDTALSVDSILIIWNNQQFEVIKNIEVNKTVIVFQKDAKGLFNYADYFPASKPVFKDISSENGCNWYHKENIFFDFNVQYLIPHAQSARGPKLAVADVNKDGLDDFYICGAKGEIGVLMMQKADGKFEPGSITSFTGHTNSEDVDAIFFDSNKDSFPDLYVVSGGNEYEDGNQNLADRLYINDGKGKFSYIPNAIPSILTNKSTVAVADVNKDGALDLFVGGFAAAKKYGILQDSYLLLNDGKGIFKQATPDVINLKDAGMITASSFDDINNDGWVDLITAGEWMPVKVFINSKGKFTPADISGSTGLWQSLYTTDINGDGFIDILGGNWGLNSKLMVKEKAALKLYVKDFDGNGNTEQVMTYTINNREYTFLVKDELEKALPVLKKTYLSYSEAAGKTVQQLFKGIFSGAKELKAEILASSCFINDGKGNFSRINLPVQAQLSPVMTFATYTINNKNAILAAGNFYGVIPYEGQYDAMIPTLFDFDKKNSVFKNITTLPNITGQIRDAKWLNYAGDKVLIIAGNNQPLIFLKPVN